LRGVTVEAVSDGGAAGGAVGIDDPAGEREGGGDIEVAGDQEVGVEGAGGEKDDSARVVDGIDVGAMEAGGEGGECEGKGVVAGAKGGGEIGALGLGEGGKGGGAIDEKVDGDGGSGGVGIPGPSGEGSGGGEFELTSGAPARRESEGADLANYRWRYCRRENCRKSRC
jgi:hypothetical protein